MALILHELMTNAAKYGSLSTSGHVQIDWEMDYPNLLLFTWVECGGPRVQDRKKTGFGSTLIERVAAHELQGECTLEFPSDGLRCRLRFPI